MTPVSPIASGKRLLVDGSSYLPTAVVKGGPHLRCRCRPAGTLAQDIAAHNLPPVALSPVPSFPGLTHANVKPKTAVEETMKDDTNTENDPVWWKDAVITALKYDDPGLRSSNGKSFCVRLDIRLIIISPVGPLQKCR
jgi:hypothetical protein